MSRKASGGRRRDAGGRGALPEPRRESLGESLRTFALALLLALGIRTFLVQTFYVPSGSMLETLLIGDHVFVNKVLYGIRIPGTDWRLPGLRLPERGDVVVFRAARGRDGRVLAADRGPELPREDFIKRIVAVPGDRVEMHGGRLQVNGEPVGRAAERRVFVDPSGRPLEVGAEAVPRCRYAVLDDPARPPIDLAPVRLPPARYFVMGDNRDDSHDSRFFGSVRFQEILGSAGLIYWSWDWNGSWLSLANPLTWWRNLTGHTRWSRIGRSVSCS